jgi:hypothetical protein
VTPRAAEIALRVAPAVAWDDERLGVSAGVVPAREEATGQDYAPEALVPRAPFRRVELDGFGARRDLSRGQTMGVFRISDGLLAALRRETDRAQDRGGMSHRIDDICAELASDWDVRAAPTEMHLSRNRAGLRTVTRDPVTHRFVGLHLDTFHDRYDAVRADVGNRVSVNIGARPRLFLFVPLAFRSLYTPARDSSERTDVAAEFLRRHPSQPVLRVRIDPGDGYVAPTESIVHDAASLSGPTDDLHVTGRGVFDPRVR